MDMRNESYEPYDIVLEYLLSTQQAATIEEANYIMTEMDAQTIQDIVEVSDDAYPDQVSSGQGRLFRRTLDPNSSINIKNKEFQEKQRKFKEKKLKK